jgi:HEAT repeat protein
VAWRIWWSYNREAVVGMRGRIRSAVTTSGGTDGKNELSPLGDREDEVRKILRRIALHDKRNSIRAAAIIALGRMGNDDDARSMIRLLHNDRTHREVREAAAVALAILPDIKDPAVKKAAREWLMHIIKTPKALTTRNRGLCLLAAGLRGRNDPVLVMQLTGRATGIGLGSEEAGTIAYALGLTGSAMAMPELSKAAKKSKLGRTRLSDIGRAHAATSLGLIGDANACRALTLLVISRRAREQTRRSAVLALGRVMAERELPADLRERARKALAKALHKDRDVLVRSFAAVALGGMRETEALGTLDRSLRSGGRVTIKPFCALGIGLWARNASPAARVRAHEVLKRELGSAREPQLTAALCVAAGLAEAKSMRDDLVALLARRGKPAVVRGSAAEGLGLMGSAHPEVVEELEKVLAQGKKGDVLRDAAVALGMLGRRGAAGKLARILKTTDSTAIQGRIILSLGHLGHKDAIDPMLSLLKNEGEPTLVREFAAVALGMMGDRRAEDPLFSLDAWFNYYATTRATNEFLRLY